MRCLIIVTALLFVGCHRATKVLLISDKRWDRQIVEVAEANGGIVTTVPDKNHREVVELLPGGQCEGVYEIKVFNRWKPYDGEGCEWHRLWHLYRTPATTKEEPQ